MSKKNQAPPSVRVAEALKTRVQHIKEIPLIGKNSRRIYIIEVDLPPRADGSDRWTSEELSTIMTDTFETRMLVLGQLDLGSFNATEKKLKQLAREIDENDSFGNIVHSAHKLQSFFRDTFPRHFWDLYEAWQAKD